MSGSTSAAQDAVYRKIDKKEGNHLSTTIALYLYCRGFFLEDKPIAPEKKEAVDYWLGQAKRHWLALGERSTMGRIVATAEKARMALDRLPESGRDLCSQPTMTRLERE